MGCVTATAKRRRKQAVNGYKHVDPHTRPHYPKPSLGFAEKRAMQKLNARITKRQRGGK